MPTQQEILKTVFTEALLRLLDAQDGGDGFPDEETQFAVHQIMALSREEVLPQLEKEFANISLSTSRVDSNPPKKQTFRPNRVRGKKWKKT
jgi:hypothetical protein